MALRRIIIDIDIEQNEPYDVRPRFGMLIKDENGELNLEHCAENRVKREFERLAQVAMDSLRA